MSITPVLACSKGGFAKGLHRYHSGEAADDQTENPVDLGKSIKRDSLEAKLQ